MSELTGVSRGRRMLAQAESVKDVAAVIDYAEAAREAAHRVHLSAAEVREYAILSLDAQREAGQRLAGLPRTTRGHFETDTLSVLIGVESAEEAQQKSSRWQRVAAISEDTYRAYLKSIDGEDMGRGGLFRFVDEIHLENRRERVERVAAARAIKPDERRFAVIYADPPWRHDFVYNPRKAVPYPTMTVEEIKKYPVPAAPDAVLFCWATAPLLVEALQVLDAWGFEYKTHLVWVKNQIAQGYYVRGKHELLLIARRGDIPVPRPGDRPPSVIIADRREHSQKPEETYELIERMFPNLPRAELFARNNREGWVAFGNEVPC